MLNEEGARIRWKEFVEPASWKSIFDIFYLGLRLGQAFGQKNIRDEVKELLEDLDLGHKDRNEVIRGMEDIVGE